VKAIIDKVETLLEALPYIRRFSGKTVVIKYGGNAMIRADLKPSFAQDIVLLKYVGINPVIVHGGGPQIGAMLDKLGIESRFVRGLRVTDQETMDVVEMVLVGKVNKEIVDLINSRGGQAVGLSGKDGALVIGERVSEELGMVGEVVKVNPSVIEALGTNSFIPVIAPVATGPGGESFNINADLVASAIARALGAEKLILLTDVTGIHDKKGELIAQLSLSQAGELLRSGAVGEGMIPKVECCIAALQHGVKRTHIIDGRVLHAVLLEIFTDEGVGTVITGDPA